MKPNEIEKLPIGLQSIYSDMEENIMADIIRRIKKTGSITETADYLINRQIYLGGSSEYITAEIKKALDLSDKEINLMFNEAVNQDYTENEDLYKKANKDFIPYEDNKVLQQQISAITMQTKDELYNITQSLGFAIKGSDGKITFKTVAWYYQENLDRAIFNLITGTSSYDEIIKKTVKEMTNSGIRVVDYANGWHNRITVATRRAVMTGLGQVTAEINKYNMEKLDTEYVEVSWHSGARNTGAGYLNHASWQGKVYKYKELETVCGYGQGGGLAGWNCRHSFTPFIPGISEPIYTSEQLQNMMANENKTKIYNGKKYNAYQASQRQRDLETELRRQRSIIKLLEEGGADKNTILAAKIKYKTMTSEYKAFSKSMKLPEQMQRIYVDNLGRVGKGLVKLLKSDIIQVSSTSQTASPNSITQIISKNGGITRNYYDTEGKWIKQITNHDHGNRKNHPFGEKGEHTHDIVWKDGKIAERPVREMTENERKENEDIL